jgi:transcriptional regulator with XRE-family HTH domain
MMSERSLRVKEWRERRSLSQSELAERAGVAKLTVTRLERPSPTKPHPKTIRLLAEALGIEPADLWALREWQDGRGKAR